MPHMANMPWIFLYLSLSLCIFVMQSNLSFTAKQIKMLNPKNIKINSLNKTNWKW